MRRLIHMPYEFTSEEYSFIRELMLDENVRRSTLFAKVIIGIETVLAVVDLGASVSNIHGSFHFSFYFMMYMLMIILNIGVLIVAKRYEKWKGPVQQKIICYETLFVIYAVVFMLWGSIITLVDQRLYGQLMAFVVNVISLSVVFYFRNRLLLIPYILSTLVLFIGLPFYQTSTNVLIGHYVNISIFLFFSWVATRILYITFFESLYRKVLLSKSNERLQEEIEENKRVHRQLTSVNEELMRLSFVDELTGIPNRRALYQRIERLLLEEQELHNPVSLIMVDIDYFKPFNDNYGHVEGDRVIKAIGQEINMAVRHSTDLACRIGGEEFLFVACNTKENEIARLAENIRRRINEMAIRHEYSAINDYVSVSLGTATGIIKNSRQFTDLMRLSDESLYVAKSEGRNCVRSSPNLINPTL
ncbi:GGDEF domain-containing protein [Paenibacillus wynnii]|uniref:GGDEF domain-containing protein n=1 Tax=Paenibacillus wynnii TaxID=268407 RepID=UPI00278E1AC8|nr:diguanylate cyclase [Paenibacillus wynnii]MDQ0195419.1 diguanylate cyclase (GGDEF)-like protein [Paenibacillus wynnii]